MTMRDPRPMEPPIDETLCQCRNPACSCWGDCRESADDYGTVFLGEWRCSPCDDRDYAEHVLENE